MSPVRADRRRAPPDGMRGESTHHGTVPQGARGRDQSGEVPRPPHGAMSPERTGLDSTTLSWNVVEDKDRLRNHSRFKDIRDNRPP